MKAFVYAALLCVNNIALSSASGKSGIKGIIRQPRQALPFHLAATLTGYPPHEELQVQVMLATGQIADQTKPLIVKRPVPTATAATGRFFWRRRNANTRTCGFPK